MQSTSWETLGWKKHKLESRLPGDGELKIVLATTWDLHEWREEWSTSFPPAAWTSPSPPPPFPTPGELGYSCQAPWIGRASKWAGPGSRGGGGGVPALPLPILTPSCLPILSSIPRPHWRRKIFYFLLFITLGPLFFLPINLSHLHKRNRHAPQGWLDKDFYFLLHKNIFKN